MQWSFNDDEHIPWESKIIIHAILSHDQDTIHVEKECAEMCNFCMAALMFLTGHGIKQEPMPMQKSHISQLGASSEPGKYLACGLVLPGTDDAPHEEMCDFCTGGLCST